MSCVHSMTGFAVVEAALPSTGRGFSLTLKSVNHRHLDLALRLTAGLDSLEPLLRAAIKAAVRRGHVELTLAVEKSSTGAVQLDRTLLEEYAKIFGEAAAHLHLDQQLDLNAVLRIPGVLASSAAVVHSPDFESAVLAAVAELLERFNRARSVEGEALAVELRASMKRLHALADEAASLRAGIGAAELQRLKVRLEELLPGVQLNEERLLAEAALLAGRSDVEEELVRLRTHVTRFLELLNAGGEVGRPLDFLLQEMNREANTALSKSGGSASEAGLRLTEIGLAIKVELERAREQVQNLE